MALFGCSLFFITFVLVLVFSFQSEYFQCSYLWVTYTYSINMHKCWIDLCATASSTRLIYFKFTWWSIGSILHPYSLFYLFFCEEVDKICCIKGYFFHLVIPVTRNAILKLSKFRKCSFRCRLHVSTSVSSNQCYSATTHLPRLVMH